MIITGHNDFLDATVLNDILPTISFIFEPIATEARSIDFNYFPPLVTLLIYKAALLTTQRLSIGIDGDEGLARLRILRKCLSLVSERWLSCSK
jgi:hypothetical protein